MAFRQCECVVKLPDGRDYRVTVNASSVYAAALAFRDHCNGPGFPDRPRINAETKIEVKPIHFIEMKNVLAYEKGAAARKNRLKK